MKKLIPMLMIPLVLTACVKQEPEPEPEPDMYKIVGSAKVYLSTVDQAHLYDLIENGATLYASADAPKSGFDVTIDPNKTYQNILGVGASFTDSSAYLINSVLSESARDDLMTKLFSKTEGIGISFIRNPMGASDYSRTVYSYDDQPVGQKDEDLSDFSIDHDRTDIIPLTKQALAINPDLKVMMSPWSPPGWMKSNDNMIGGKINSTNYPIYAQYFVKTIQAYKEEGIDLFAVTIQNEPYYSPADYPGSLWQDFQQATFIRDYLKPAFVEAGISSKILALDHNWDLKDQVLSILEKAGDSIDGVAWHVYGGDVRSQSEVHNAYPDHDVYFTEASGGEWVPPFEAAFFGEIKTGIDVFRNWSRTYVLWNMALDENNGPVVPEFLAARRSTCRGVVTINQKTKEVTYNLDYYALAHFSGTIQKDAVRIDSNTAVGNYMTVAFMNPDKTISVVVYNMQSTHRDALIHVGETTLVVNMPGKSVATVLFQTQIVQ